MTYNTAQNSRPIPVTVVAFIFIAAGVFGFIYHTMELFEETQLNFESGLVLFLRALALVIGLFLLRGANWARWLALAWMAYHSVLGIFHSTSEALIHLALLVVIAFLLFFPKAAAYFTKK